MTLILDNLSAMLVGATVFLMLLSTQLRVTEMNVEQTTSYMMKNQASSLATWVEEDILQIGQNIDKEVEAPYENPIQSNGVTTQFTFYRDSVNTTITPPDTIRVSTRYETEEVGYRIVDQDTVTVLRLNRTVKYGTGSWIAEGQSPPLVSVFRVDMLDADAQIVADPVAALAADPLAVRNTRIRFAMVAPYDLERSTLQQVYYGSNLIIPN